MLPSINDILSLFEQSDSSTICVPVCVFIDGESYSDELYNVEEFVLLCKELRNASYEVVTNSWFGIIESINVTRNNK